MIATAVLTLVFLVACEPEETAVDATCSEAFAAVPVIGDLESIDQFYDAIYTLDLTIVACESLDQWEAAAEERLDVAVDDPAQFIWSRCIAVAPPATGIPPGVSPLPEVDRALLPAETPLCIDAAELLEEV